VVMQMRSRVRPWVERALRAHLVPDEQIALAFEWEHLRRFLAHFQVDCVFDVGGNAGQYATMLRAHAGYRGPIVSYEPIPELAAKMRSAAAQDPRWFIEELALDATEGFADLNVYVSHSFSSLHDLSALAEQQFGNKLALQRRIRVRTATLASEFGKHQARLGFRRPYLKMDTQGHDVEVAVGAGSHLRDFVGLQSELAIQKLYSGTPGYEEALAFYRAHGFELSALVPNNLGHFPRLLEIDCIMYRA
jgi:FkbM family methyltransferase